MRWRQPVVALRPGELIHRLLNDGAAALRATVNADGEEPDAVHRLHFGAEARAETEYVPCFAQRCTTLEAPNEIRVVLGAGFLEAMHDVVQLGGLMFDIFLIGAVLASGKFAVTLPESGLETLVARGGLVGALACTAFFAEAIAQDVAGPFEDFLEHVELRKLPAQAADA